MNILIELCYENYTMERETVVYDNFIDIVSKFKEEEKLDIVKSLRIALGRLIIRYLTSADSFKVED